MQGVFWGRRDNPTPHGASIPGLRQFGDDIILPSLGVAMSDTQALIVRLPRTQHAKLKAHSCARAISMNDLIRLAVEAMLRDADPVKEREPAGAE
jgi:hypothetical protein